MATLERIPRQLEPPEPPTPPEKVEPEKVEPEKVEPEKVEPTPSEPPGVPREEGTERRSWWREFFGFGE